MQELSRAQFGLGMAGAISHSQLSRAGTERTCTQAIYSGIQTSSSPCTLKVCTDVILWPDTLMFGNAIICLVLLVSSPLFLSSLSHQG